MKTMKKRLFIAMLCMLVVVALFALVACQDNDNPGETKKLDHITLNTDNVKTEFEVGDELDYTGLVVRAHYDDETSAMVANYGVTVNDLDEGKLTVNSDTVTVSYTEDGITKTATYGITVVPAYTGPVVASIEVKTQPTKTNYYVGETLDLTGLELTVTYEDATPSATVTSGFTADTTALTTASTDRTVTITYGGKTATITINVYDKLESIYVTGTQAYEVGDEFTVRTFSVYALYNGATTDGTKLDEKTQERNGFEWTITDNLEFGTLFEVAKTYTIEVTYTEDYIDKIEKTATFAITVTDPGTGGGDPVEKKLDHITLNTDGVTKEFNVGEELTYTGLVVTAHYDDETSAVVTANTVTANNLDEGKLTVASDTVTVSYTEDGVTKIATYNITVTDPNAGGGDDVEPEEIQFTSSNPYGEGGGFIWFRGEFSSELIDKDTTTMETTITKNGEPTTATATNLFNGEVQVQIEGSKYDNVVINFTFKNDGKIVATGKLEFKGVTELILSEDEVSIQKDTTKDISVIKLNGSDDLSGKSIAWTITEGTEYAIITGDSNGTKVTITAIAEGQAILTCEIDGITATCTITVTEGEVVEQPPVDVSDKLKENNVYEAGLGYCVNIRYECGAEMLKNIADVEVSVTKDGQPTQNSILQKHDDGANYYVHVSVDADWTHDYVFTLNYKNAAGKVIATGTFTKEAQKSLKLDVRTVNLKLGETVTGTVTATITGKFDSDIQWSIDGNDQIATIVVSEDKMSVTVTAVAKGEATITASIGDLTATCKVIVADENEEPPVSTTPVVEIIHDNNHPNPMFAQITVSLEDYNNYLKDATRVVIKGPDGTEYSTGFNGCGYEFLGTTFFGGAGYNIQITTNGTPSGEYTIEWYNGDTLLATTPISK